MIFDQSYFNSTWGTLHRHDYIESWAQQLKQYPRVLDCGTGCGFMVKRLRELGVDAWGVDTSEYAIANSCAPGYVLNASVTDLPFSDDRFDVVFSNGLWEYLSEDEITKGKNEIWRVGNKQIHNIDHDKCDFRSEYVTWKSQDWWDEQLAAPKILVSCPTHQCKEYAHEAWVEMSKTIDYPNYEVLVVDNSPNSDCAKRWGFEWLGKSDGLDIAQRMSASMEIVRQRFLSGNYRSWWNVEIDVIPDRKMLKLLIRYGENADWTAHCYPCRGGADQSCSGIGCSLWSRRLIEDFSFGESPVQFGNGIDSYFWDWVRPQNKYRTREFWGHLPIQHLLEPEGTPYG